MNSFAGLSVEHWTVILGVVVGLAVSPGSVSDEQAAPGLRSAVKGGDDRNGGYDAVPNWWKPAPEHDSVWTWGEVSGLAAATSARRGPGRQCVRRQLGRRLGHEVHTEAGSGCEQARRTEAGPSALIMARHHLVVAH